MSSYVSETNVVAKVIDSTINRSPCIAQAKPVEMNSSSIHSWRLPPKQCHLGLFKTQLTVSVRSEVIQLRVKLKVAILSIHS
jgi:hypothetical protein